MRSLTCGICDADGLSAMLPDPAMPGPLCTHQISIEVILDCTHALSTLLKRYVSSCRNQTRQ